MSYNLQRKTIYNIVNKPRPSQYTRNTGGNSGIGIKANRVYYPWEDLNVYDFFDVNMNRHISVATASRVRAKRYGEQYVVNIIHDVHTKEPVAVRVLRVS